MNVAESGEPACGRCGGAASCECAPATEPSALPNGGIVIAPRDETVARRGWCGTWQLYVFDTLYEDAEYARLREWRHGLPDGSDFTGEQCEDFMTGSRQDPGWPWRTVEEMAADFNGAFNAAQAAAIQEVLRAYPRTVPDPEFVETVHQTAKTSYRR